ncbi:MAG TPA: sensor domain-containing protein [Mycobacterium sp.]
MRRQAAALVLIGVSTLAIGCTSTVSGRPVPADNSGPRILHPVSVSALDGLLLDPNQVNNSLKAGGMKVWFSANDMWDWSAGVSDNNCLAVDGPAQDRVYAGTGWIAMRGQRLDDSVDGSRDRNHYAIQAVVAYPSAHEAKALYESSVGNWAACASRQFSDAPKNQTGTVWTVSDTHQVGGTLSISEVQEGGRGWSCQRALTARNNVAIDTVTCAYFLAGGSAVDIAQQIAAKIPQ